MIIDKIRFANVVNNHRIDINVGGALPSDLYMIKSIDGLGPPDIVMTQSDSLEVDGAIENMVFHNRQLVITLGLNANYAANVTPDQLREPFYRLMLAKGQKPMRLWFQMVGDTDYKYYVDGAIVKMPVTPFSKTTDIQITFDCLSPFINSLQVHPTYSKSGWQLAIDNPGTAPSPFTLRMTIDDPSPSLQILMDQAYWQDPLDPSGSGPGLTITRNFVSGDEVFLATIPGSKYVGVYVGDGYDSLLRFVDGNAVWPQLMPGSNGLNILTAGGNTVLEVTIEPKYMGI